MSDIPDKDDAPEKKFLAFLYPEIKDLAKQFLTLIAGVLVFAVAFADKIVPFNNASGFQKASITIALLAWVAAVVFVGMAIFTNYVAGVRALQHGMDHRRLIPFIYVLLDLGGVSFVIGLLAISLAALANIHVKIS